MQMLSDNERYGNDRVGARLRDEAAAARAARPAGAEMLSSPMAAGPGAEACDSHHTISLTTAYGEPVADEDVTDSEFGAALRRIYNQAIPRANAVVVIDGIMHTRNSFLEFVREFNDWAARQRAPHAAT
jgi:hypothetical protein